MTARTCHHLFTPLRQRPERCAARREERGGVIPRERRATQQHAIPGLAPRRGPVPQPYRVAGLGHGVTMPGGLAPCLAAAQTQRNGVNK